MNISDYKWYIQDAIEKCDHCEADYRLDFTDLINQIRKIKEIGISSNIHLVSLYAHKIPDYISENYKLDFLGRLIWIFLTRVSWRPLISNKESSRQKRYIIETKLFLHGIEDALRKQGF